MPETWTSCEIVADYVVNDLCVVPQPGLFDDARSMRADRFHAQIQAGGDFADRLSGAEQTEDPELSVSEPLMRQQLAAAETHIGSDRGGHVRADIRPAGGNAPNRLNKVGRGALFLNVPRRASSKRPNGEELLGVH